MGNSESHDFLPIWEPEQKVLDLTRAVDHEEYCKHIKGIFSSETLTVLPNNILEEISLYETLLVQFNSLTKLPTALPLHLPHLKYLDLSYNVLTELPESFGLFYHMQVLILKSNKLEKIPQSLTSLKVLEKADFSCNRLQTLPEDLGNLKQLEKLNLSHNRLTYLPKSLFKCKNLTVILANDNFCQNPPQEICDSGSEDLLDYIKRHFDDGTEKIAELTVNIFPRVWSNQIPSPNSNSPHLKYIQIQTQTQNNPSPIKTPLSLPYNSSKLPTDVFRDKIIGLIYGAAIGDALGLATDFLSPDECKFYYDPKVLNYSQIITDEHRSHWKKGLWTSNTDHMLIILDSIIQWAGVVDELDFAQKLLLWKKHGLIDEDIKISNPGYTISPTINHITSLKDFHSNPHGAAENFILKNHTNGIHDGEQKSSQSSIIVDDAALPSSIILGILHFYNLREVVSNSIRICKATHAHPECVASNVTISCIVALLLQGKYDEKRLSDINTLITAAKLMGEDYLTDKNRVTQFYECFNESLKTKYSSTHPYIILHRAVYALRSQCDFRNGLMQILMKGGHASMAGCVCGAILGCMTGFKKLPKELIEELDRKGVQQLNTRINALLDMMAV